MADQLPIAAYLLEFGAVDLPKGNPSRITDFEAFHTEADMNAAVFEYASKRGAVVWLSDAQADIQAAEQRAVAAEGLLREARDSVASALNAAIQMSREKPATARYFCALLDRIDAHLSGEKKE